MHYWDDPKRIPLAECKHRGLYRLISRNLAIGVYSEPTQGFVGIRTKFGRKYPFEEHHVDYPGPYKTAAPMELLPDELPPGIDPVESLAGSWCSECHAPSEYAKWPEGGEREVALATGGTMKVPGQWQHSDGTRCENMHAYFKSNEALHRWLEEMERKHVRAAAT